MSNTIPLRGDDDRTTRLNVLGSFLQLCSCEPVTGWFRDGSCATADNDYGHHTICAIMNEDFLQFSKSHGNDLTTPRDEFDFPGLKSGDHWCLCSRRWLEALDAGVAPKVDLMATHRSTLSVVSLQLLQSYSHSPAVSES